MGIIVNDNHSLKPYLAALALPIFLSSLSTSIANIALPVLTIAFETSFFKVQWVVVAYLVSLTSATIITGSIGDRLNRRAVLIGATLLFIGSSILCALSPTINWLITFRLFQGIAAAAMINTTMALIAGLNTKHGNGVAMGWIGSLSAIGTATGPTLGGFLIGLWGWQSIFLINIPVALIALGLIIRFIEPQSINHHQKKPIDKLGISVLTLAIITYAFSMTYWSQYSVVLLLVSLSCFVFFILIERHIAFPIISISLLKQPSLFVGAILSLLVSSVMMTTLIVGPFYLLHKLALSPWHVGLVLSFGPVIAASFGIPAGKLVDKFGANTLVSFALLLMLSGFTLFFIFTHHLTVWVYMIIIAIITTGYAIFQTANNTSILFSVESNEKGLLAGIINLSRNIGLINGATLMGSLFSLFTGSTVKNTLVPDNIAHGFMLIFGIAACIILFAFLLALWHQKQANKKKTFEDC